MEKKWRYEKMDENFNIKTISDFHNDADGSITGHHVINTKAWFDENPEERIRLGWTKHYYLDTKDIKKELNYNSQTQNLITSVKQIDDYTVEDEYHIIDKSEEQLAFEQLLALSNSNSMWFFE